MATVEKKILHAAVGCGGVKCPCCRPKANRAVRVLSRAAKRRARRVHARYEQAAT